MGSVRVGMRVVVTEGWARGRHGVVTHTVTQDGLTFASVRLDGQLFAEVGIDDLVAEPVRAQAGGPRAPGRAGQDIGQRDMQAGEHDVPPSAAA